MLRKVIGLNLMEEQCMMDKDTSLTLGWLTPKVIFNIGVMVVIALMVVVLSRPTQVVVNEHGIDVKGMYGKLYLYEKMEDLTLLKTLPKIVNRSNGIDLGQVKRGYFELQGSELATLFISHKEAPYILFKYANRTVIMNFKDMAQTQAIYDAILEHGSNEN